jgi:hypothetical protein
MFSKMLISNPSDADSWGEGVERVLTVSTQTGIPALGPSGQHRVRPSHAHTPYFAQIEGHLLITTDYS